MIQQTVNVTRSWGGSTRDFLRAVYNFLAGFRMGQVAINPPNILANTTVDVAAIALPAGTAAIGDYVDMQPPATLEHGLVFQSARIDVADQLTVRISNVTAGAIDGANLTWTYKVIKVTAARPIQT